MLGSCGWALGFLHVQHRAHTLQNSASDYTGTFQPQSLHLSSGFCSDHLKFRLLDTEGTGQCAIPGEGTKNFFLIKTRMTFMAIGCTQQEKKMFYREMEVVNVVPWGKYIYYKCIFIIKNIYHQPLGCTLLN